MAMNKATLASAINTAIAGLSDDDKKNVTKIWEAIGDEIIKHIKTNAVVTVPATGISAPNGACTGSATGTIA